MSAPKGSRDKLVSVARALSSETRVRLLELLHERPLCVNALACRLRVTQAAVSQHLKLLREVGLVAGHREGPFIHYRLCPAPLDLLQQRVGELAASPQAPGRTSEACCRAFETEAEPQEASQHV